MSAENAGGLTPAVIDRRYRAGGRNGRDISVLLFSLLGNSDARAHCGHRFLVQGAREGDPGPAGTAYPGNGTPAQDEGAGGRTREGQSPASFRTNDIARLAKGEGLPEGTRGELWREF